MNDKFLLENRPEIDHNFTSLLYQRLTVNYPEKKNTIKIKNIAEIFKWQYTLPVFIITAGLLFTFSAPVRAKALELIRIIAGINIQEQSVSPLMELSLNGCDLSEIQDSCADNSATVKNKPTIYPVQTAKLPEVLKNPPFEFGLPTWTPDGYSMDQTVGLSSTDSWISMVWKNQDMSEIELMVEKEYTGYNIPAGENSAKEITINGTSALLVRGFWDSNNQWDPYLGVTIGWKLDGHFYRLTFFQRESLHHELITIDEMDEKISELILMAESIKSAQ